MNDLFHALSTWWTGTPLYLQTLITLAILLLAGNQSLDFGRNLGAILYRIIH